MEVLLPHRELLWLLPAEEKERRTSSSCQLAKVSQVPLRPLSDKHWLLRDIVNYVIKLRGKWFVIYHFDIANLIVLLFICLVFWKIEKENLKSRDTCPMLELAAGSSLLCCLIPCKLVLVTHYFPICSLSLFSLWSWRAPKRPCTQQLKSFCSLSTKECLHITVKSETNWGFILNHSSRFWNWQE